VKRRSLSNYTLDTQTAACLAAARRGDQHEFATLAEPFRRELQAHCYRIMGSAQEAEDLVQETMLRAWQRLHTFEGRAPVRAWLYRIATNACFDALDRARARRRLPTWTRPPADPGEPLPPFAAEFSWLEPYPDEWLDGLDPGNPEARVSLRESVRLAFLVALQALPPRQRAVLILRDVLDWPAAEVAACLEMTVPAVNSALHRGRATLARHVHEAPHDRLVSRAADETTRRLLEQFVAAWENADVAGLVALLKRDALLLMPPSPAWFLGREAIGQILAGMAFAGDARGRWRLLPTGGANGQPAFGLYESGADAIAYAGRGLMVLDGAGGVIGEVTVFFNPALFAWFGLPLEIAKT
jgi:RNA polymerase sigma-70 factor (ECF subfamily)